MQALMGFALLCLFLPNACEDKAIIGLTDRIMSLVPYQDVSGAHASSFMVDLNQVCVARRLPSGSLGLWVPAAVWLPSHPCSPS